ncbi:MAG: 7-cyano-7-deazaguanine synthase [Anaerolineae bacterium]|nr:7-cyano-7-deazaguanine synthase [Anaerolineae bacterium]
MYSVIVCLSGGIDSTALIHYYLARGLSPQAICFDYGQAALEAEKKAALAVTQYYQVPLEIVRLTPIMEPLPSGEFVGRNLRLIFAALSHFNGKMGLVSLGIHAQTGYYDCSPVFVDQVQTLLDGYYGGGIILDVPFLKFTKSDIVSYCISNQIPVDLTYSCERGSDVCGCCASCIERRRYGLDQTTLS